MNPREQAARLEKVYKARRLPSQASIAEIRAAVAAVRKERTMPQVVARAPVEDWYECLCSNRPDGSGFVPAVIDPDGTVREVSPVIGGEWESLYVCVECGRVLDQATYDPYTETVGVVRGPGPYTALEEA